MSDDVQQILERYLDDRDQLSDDEIAMMVVSLRKSPELASQLKEQLLLNEYLGQRFGVDRQNFVAQVEQRIRDVKVDEEEIDEQVGELRTLAENELENWNRRNRRAQTVRFWIGSALLVLIAAGLGAWYVWAPPWREIATVISVIGDVRGPSRPKPGEKIMPGDEFRTAKDQYITFQYSDGTMIQVGGNSSIQFPANYTGRGKQLLINRGNVAAKVQPQKSGPLKFVTPIAVAEVLGTELFLSVGPTGTRLDVTEGTVKLTNTTSGDKSVRVMAGNYGVATKKEVTVQPVNWPSNRDGLAFLFQAANEPNFAKDWISGLHRRCFVESQSLAGLNGQVMSLANGSFRPLGVDNSLRKACRETNQLTIEAVIQADQMQQCDPARIITFSTGPDRRNFSLSQSYDKKLTFQIRTSQSAADHLQLPIEICQLPDENPHHFVLSYKSGRLVAYLDGQIVCDRPEVRGDFSNWSREHLLFGAEHGKILDWSGKLEGIAIYNRFMNADEAEHNSQEYRKLLDARSESTDGASTE